MQESIRKQLESGYASWAFWSGERDIVWFEAIRAPWGEAVRDAVLFGHWINDPDAPAVPTVDDAEWDAWIAADGHDSYPSCGHYRDSAGRVVEARDWYIRAEADEQQFRLHECPNSESRRANYGQDAVPELDFGTCTWCGWTPEATVIVVPEFVGDEIVSAGLTTTGTMLQRIGPHDPSDDPAITHDAWDALIRSAEAYEKASQEAWRSRQPRRGSDGKPLARPRKPAPKPPVPRRKD